MASTSSSIIPSKTIYDVFLSFSGIDTRKNFTSHLYSALRRNHITTFMDDPCLERGEEISPTLLKAIEESKMWIIIFSKNYASSRWCLDELVKIMECKKCMGRKVLPIFYHVDPSDVRNQTGVFGVEFGKVEERFWENKKRIDRWIIALRDAANLSGWDSTKFRHESELSEAVVNQILKTLYPAYFRFCSDLSGIDSHINLLLFLLSIGSTEVRFIGIWGMGGIGKTTIAEVLLSRMSDQFDDFCFFRNIRENSEKADLVHLRKCLFSTLLRNENLNMEMLHVIPTFVLDMLSRKKVFIVLDDVNDSEQLEALAGDRHWFGPGSRILVTSRDREVLNNGVDVIYEVRGLQDDDALRLLSMKAFKQKHPPKDFTEVSERVVNYSKGVPLALKVLGSHLCKRSPKEWENALDRLKQFPNSKIQKILEISYDSLEQSEKDIFLDIACFFKGRDKTWVEDILNGCGLAASMGINRLTDKCLIFIMNNILEMHDLLQEMGRDIARQKRSRLWNAIDIRDLLLTATIKEGVEGIFLDMSNVGKVQLNGATFSQMPNLRLLKFFWPRYSSNKKDSGFVLEPTESNHLQYLSSKLSLLHWEEYPFKSLPSTFFVESLVQLNLQESSLEQLWTGDKYPKQLKYMDLSGSMELVRLPNLSSATKLEQLNLEHCESLLEIPSWIQSLHNLKSLNLNRCKNLRSLPSLIHLKSLTVLNLSYCSNLRSCPSLHGLCLEELYLDGTGLTEISNDIVSLIPLRVLSLNNCERLQVLPQVRWRRRMGLQEVIRTFVQCRNYMGMGPQELIRTSLQCTISSSSLESTENSENVEYQFNCCNCLNLDQNARFNILEAARLRIENMAIVAAMPAEDDFRSYARGNIDVVLTGSEIPDWDSVGLPSDEAPEWFSYQTEGSSICVQLPPCWFDATSFTFSAVVEFEDPLNQHDWFSLTCQCRFKSCNGSEYLVDFERKITPLKAVLKSDHLFLWYNNFRTSSNFSEWLRQNDVGEALFEFKATCVTEDVRKGVDLIHLKTYMEFIGPWGIQLKVKRCGVQLLRVFGRKMKWKPSRERTKLSVEHGGTKRRSREDFFCSNQTDIIETVQKPKRKKKTEVGENY